MSLSGLGDVDGDGYSDALITSINLDLSGDASGGVYLLYGGTSRWDGDVSLASADAVFVGEEPGDLAGWSVAHAGDVTGDGFGDVLIGAVSAGSATEFGGAAYLVVSDGTRASGQIDLSAADAKYTASASGDFVGYSVDAAGDVNADGYGDYLMGATGDGDSGAAYLFWGTASPQTGPISLQTIADVARFEGGANGDALGVAVSGIGDVNGDGFGDIVLGADGVDTGGDSAGAAYVVLGMSDFATRLDITTADATLTGVTAAGRAGKAVSGAGDVNGDGYPDLLVGAFGVETSYLLYGPY